MGAKPVEAVGGERVLDLRSLVGTLRPAEAALLGYARGILYRHRHQRYCGTCGSPTRSGHGGHLRTCQNEACARLHFPRVEPAVIMLVESQGKCLLARHKGPAAGSYSTLAPCQMPRWRLWIHQKLSTGAKIGPASPRPLAAR